MSQAIVDPGELRRFAANLKRFNADLHAGLGGILVLCSIFMITIVFQRSPA